MMKFVVALIMLAHPLGLLAQKWELSPESTLYKEFMTLAQDLPPKLDLLVGNYEGSASVKCVNDTVIVGNIRWGGTFDGVSVNTTLEETIFKSNGKIRKAWEARLKKRLEATIKRELSFYKGQ